MGSPSCNFNKINIDSPFDRYNLSKLAARKKAELFVVRNGRIVTINIFQKILYILIKPYRTSENRLLRRTIDDLTAKIRLNDTTEDGEKKFLEDLFFNRLASLNRKVYKRALDTSVFDYFKNKMVTEVLPPSATLEYQKNYTSAKIWARLGSYKMPQGGVGGSYCIIQNLRQSESLTTFKKKLGIYKPFDEDTFAAKNPKLLQRIKYLLGKTLFPPMIKLSLNTIGGQAFLAEVATKIIENFVVRAIYEDIKTNSDIFVLPIEFVPDTQVANMSLGKQHTRMGSYQLWVQKPYQSLANRFLNITRHYNGNASILEQTKTKLPLPFLEILSIIDIVSGNFDRHGGNWIIIHNEKEQISEIRLIDGGWSMAPGHIKKWNFHELKNHYLWAKLPTSLNYFSELGKSIIEYLKAHQDELCTEIKSLYNTHMPTNNYVNFRLEALKDRLNVLYHAKDSKMLKEIAAIRTENEIKQFLADF